MWRCEIWKRQEWVFWVRVCNICHKKYKDGYTIIRGQTLLKQYENMADGFAK